MIQKFPVNKVLGVNVIPWGMVVCCTAAASNFREITARRNLLRALEAVITPALIVDTSQWYTRGQSTPRTGIWYCGLGAGQFLGGLISWAAQHAPRTGFESWRIIFLAVGVFNLVVGTGVALWMPSSVRTADKVLTEGEMAAVEEALERDQPRSSEHKVFHARGLWEVITDLQVWFLFLNTILIVISSGVITTFSATLIRSFGYDSKQTALLNMPSGDVSIFATLTSTLAIRYRFPRWLAIVLLLVPSLTGAALMSFRSSHQATALAGIYLINFTLAPLALTYAPAGANTQGYTKRVATSGAVAVACSIANIIGPLRFQSREARG